MIARVHVALLFLVYPLVLSKPRVYGSPMSHSGLFRGLQPAATTSYSSVAAPASPYGASVPPPSPYSAPRPLSPLSSYAAEAALPPEPYQFDYQVKDEYGNGQTREEVSDENGNIQGSYSFTDANGIYRKVTYVAGKDGFRAVVNSNEPGLSADDPANVNFQVKEPPAGVLIYAPPSKYQPAQKYPRPSPIQFSAPAAAPQYPPPAAAPQSSPYQARPTFASGPSLPQYPVRPPTKQQPYAAASNQYPSQAPSKITLMGTYAYAPAA